MENTKLSGWPQTFEGSCKYSTHLYLCASNSEDVSGDSPEAVLRVHLLLVHVGRRPDGFDQVVVFPELHEKVVDLARRRQEALQVERVVAGEAEAPRRHDGRAELQAFLRTTARGGGGEEREEGGELYVRGGRRSERRPLYYYYLYLKRDHVQLQNVTMWCSGPDCSYTAN